MDVDYRAEMETREKSKKNAIDVLDFEDEPRSTDGYANVKDGGGKSKEKPKVNMERILQEIQDFRQENNEKLSGIKEELDKTNQRIGEAEGRIAETEAKLETMELIMRDVLKTQTQHKDKLIDQEARARRQNIRIYNVPEDEEGNSMETFVEKFLKETLEIPESTELQIERAHRALAPKPAATDKPRSIVVKFLLFRTKEIILRKAWEKKEIYINNQRIYFDHDYPLAILNNRKEYNEAKRVLREKKIRFQTPYPARLRVFYEDGMRLYQTASEATKDMRE